MRKLLLTLLKKLVKQLCNFNNFYRDPVYSVLCPQTFNKSILIIMKLKQTR